jgi:AcrR family transcriptional regulator
MPSNGDDGVDQGPLEDDPVLQPLDPDPAPPAMWERERLLGAMLEEVTLHGYAGCSIETVSARAGVSADVFGANFSSKEKCFIAAFDSLLLQLVAHTISTYHGTPGAWPQRLQAALSTCITGISLRSGAARAYLLESALISPETRAHRAQAVAMFEAALMEMLEDAPGAERPSEVTVAGVTGGIWRVIEARLRADRVEELPGLIDGLVAWALAYIPGEEPQEPGNPHGSRQSTLAGELIAGAISEIIERDGRESAADLAYLALAPVIGHARATATRRKVSGTLIGG